jgi:Domain of unknown function (DUF4394)/Calx-beta domain
MTYLYPTHRAMIALSALALAIILAAQAAHARSISFSERHFYALTSDNQLLLFDAHQPSVINRRTAIAGLQPGEFMLSIDFRPSDGRLYGLGSSSRIYTIDPITGIATQVSTEAFTPALSGNEFGFDFQPNPEIIRVVSDAGQNLRIDADTGRVAAVDGRLSYSLGDASAGMRPNVVGLNYATLFERETASAAFYGIDSDRDTLVTLADPVAGTLRTVGPLGVNASGQVGFDSSPDGGLAFAVLTPVGERSPKVYEIDLSPTNLTPPRASLLGPLSTTSTVLGLAIAPMSGRFQFAAPAYSVVEDATSIEITVTRTGDISKLASVDYVTVNCQAGGPVQCRASVDEAPASLISDYTDATGTLIFRPGVASRTFPVLISEDSFEEGMGSGGGETVTLLLQNPTGNFFLGEPSVTTITIIDDDSPPPPRNSIDDAATFIHQHYHDFLNREPEPGGFQGWQDILNNCPPSGRDMRGNFCDHIEVSSAFFRSPEFQQRGYFIYRFYSASFGRVPHYSEFMPDMARVSGFQSAEQEEESKLAFIDAFMARQEFKNHYDALVEPRAYVEALETAAGVVLANREALVSDLSSGKINRAQVLRNVIESTEVFRKYFNQAFVVMQYFGYLRRDPDILYLNWVDTLNRTGDYRIMVNGFINSQEYRQRFGQP